MIRRDKRRAPYFEVIGGALAATVAALGAHGQDLRPTPGEAIQTFAARVFNRPEAGLHVTTVAWNGNSTLFVDYETANAEPERQIVALRQEPSGAYRKLDVTLGEQEGGIPELKAIGFANADRDSAKELIVILAWPQVHYDVGGSLYEVRIFDDPRPGQTALTQMKISDHLGAGCDCDWRDGSHHRYRFKTISAVKSELKRLGH